MSVQLRNEIVLRAPNRPGLLADVTERLYAKSVSVLAIRAYEEGDEGVFLIFAESSTLATDALSKTPDSTISATTVITVDRPNDRGQLAAVSRALADAGINVKEIHMTAGEGPVAHMVINTEDNVAALAALGDL